MLLAGIRSNLALLKEWVDISGAQLFSPVSAFRSTAVDVNNVNAVACPTHDLSTMQVLLCSPNATSSYSLCDEWIESQKSVECKLLASLNRSSQLVNIHNQGAAAIKWNVIYSILKDTISLSSETTFSLGPWKEEMLIESFMLPPNKAISFPFSMFDIPVQVDGVSSSYHSEAVQMLYACHQLNYLWNRLELATKPVFSVNSDNSHVHAEHSLQHDLVMCQINAPTLHMYHSDNEYLFRNSASVNSRCTVQEVTHLTPVSCNNGPLRPALATATIVDSGNVPAHTTTHSTSTCVHSPTGPVAPVCIEDVMYHLLHNNNSSKNSEWLHYVSSLGYQRRVINSNRPDDNIARERTIMGFRDLIAVLRAYTDAEISAPLVVHSLDHSSASPLTQNKNLTQALSRRILEITHIMDSDATSLAAFEQATHRLSALLAARLSPTLHANSSPLPSWCPVRAALLDVLVGHYGEGGVYVLLNCRNQLSGNAPVSHICAHHSARRQLADAILQPLAMSNNANHRTNDLLKGHIASILTALVEFFPSNTAPTAPVRKAIPPTINVLIAADVFVFIFVRPEQVPYLQRLVFHWQRHGADSSNFTFMKYLIFPVYAPTTVTSQYHRNTFNDVPSLNTVLSIVERKINQLTSVKDVVYVLIGLQATLAFPQPGRLFATQETEFTALCKNRQVKRDVTSCDANVVEVPPYEGHLLDEQECNLCSAPAYTAIDPCSFINGVLPSVPVSWSRQLRLPAKIVISASPGTNSSINDRYIDKDILPWDFTAMVGIGYKLLDMISALRNNKDRNSCNNLSSVPTTYTLQRLIHKYALAHPLEVTLDCSQNVFHTTKAAILYQMLIHQQQKGRVSYTDMPILRNLSQRAVSNDTVFAMATVLGVHITDDRGYVQNPIEARRTINSLSFEDSAEAYGYRQYGPAVNALLCAYLDDTNDYYEFKQIMAGQVEHADVLVPLVTLDRLPFPKDYLSKNIVKNNTNRTCYLELSNYESAIDRVFKELFLRNRVFSTVLSLINLIHHTVICECEDMKYSMDETVYLFVRRGLLAKHATHFLNQEEFQVTAALLENYDAFLLSIFARGTAQNDTQYVANGGYRVHGHQRYGMHSDTNLIFGALLDFSEVFTPEVVALYATLSNYYKNQLLVAVRFALTSVRTELAVYTAMAQSLQQSYQVHSYQELRHNRTTWQQQSEKLRNCLSRGEVDNGSIFSRNSIQSTPACNMTWNTVSHDVTCAVNYNNEKDSADPVIRTHYVTFASDHTQGLQNLLDTAKMSGIHIEVRGINDRYEDYSFKTNAYMNYLRSSSGPHTGYSNTTLSAVPDDDVVLFMDAYDVLVFPAIVKAASVLAQSPTPIMFCAERGVYPEMPGPIFYPRGVQNAYQASYTSTDDPTVDRGYGADGSESSIESSAFSQKFLNSGCIMGRAGQLKHMLAYVHYYSRTYRDDQLAMVRYHIEHPGTVSLDVNNALFATSFKLATAPQDIQLTYDLQLYQGNKNIGLLHCNSAKSGSTYSTITRSIKHALETYYHGEEGQLLQSAIRLYSAGNISGAKHVLQHPTLLTNCTTMGGASPIRQLLLQRILVHESLKRDSDL